MYNGDNPPQPLHRTCVGKPAATSHGSHGHGPVVPMADRRPFPLHVYVDIRPVAADFAIWATLGPPYMRPLYRSQDYILNFFLDEHAPYRKLTNKEIELIEKPWITKEILEKCPSDEKKM